MQRNPRNSHLISSAFPTAVNILLAAVSCPPRPPPRRTTPRTRKPASNPGNGARRREPPARPDHAGGSPRGSTCARGFDAASADLFAINCAFMAILRNESAPGKLRFNLADWRVATHQQTRPLKLDAEWQKLWQRRGVLATARTAFHWAQLPTEHVYERRLEHGYGQHGAQAR